MSRIRETEGEQTVSKRTAGAGEISLEKKRSEPGTPFSYLCAQKNWAQQGLPRVG